MKKLERLYLQGNILAEYIKEKTISTLKSKLIDLKFN